LDVENRNLIMRERGELEGSKRLLGEKLSSLEIEIV
jgi:hypothetical protein